MFRPRSSLNTSVRRIGANLGASLLASSALAVAVTFGSALLTVEASAAQFFSVHMSSKGGTFKPTGPILKRYSSTTSGSAGSRIAPPPKGQGDGGRGPRKPPIIVKRYPPVVITPPVVLG